MGAGAVGNEQAPRLRKRSSNGGLHLGVSHATVTVVIPCSSAKLQQEGAGGSSPESTCTTYPNVLAAGKQLRDLLPRQALP